MDGLIKSKKEAIEKAKEIMSLAMNKEEKN